MEKLKAVEYALKSGNGGVDSMWLCDEDGDIGNFSNQIILAKTKEKDFDFFVQDYPRFLARIEGLALGFSTSQKPTYRDNIDFDLIQNVCDVVELMEASNKSAMSETLKTYRVKPL